MNELIDTIYDYFRGTRFVDELVFIDVPSHKHERSVERAIIRDKLPNTEPLTLEKKVGDKRQMQRELREAKEDMSRVPDDPHHYRVQLVNNPSKEFVCLPSQIRRGRQALSKMTFKKFIKEVATKEKWIGSPWQVKPQFVVRYNLPTNPPPDTTIPRFKDDIENKRRKNVDVYECPIEDTELFSKEYVLPGNPEKPVPDYRPSPSYDFGCIAEKNVFSLLKLYNYLYVNGSPLRLYPFIFDDFLNALKCQDAESPCVLICEVFGALLKFACLEFQSKFEQSTGRNQYYKPLPVKKEDGTWLNDKSDCEEIDFVMTSYQNFSVSEKVAIDQWFKWRPGQWGEPPKKKKSKSSATTQTNSAQNLKAWQVALYGLIRDWYERPGSASTSKWHLLSKLLGPARNKKSESNRVDDSESLVEMDSTIAQESNNASIDQNHDELAEDVEDVRIVPPIDHSEDELEYSPPASSKKKKRRLEYESEEDELVWSEDEKVVVKPKTPSRTSSSRTSLSATPAKKAITPSKSKPKTTPKKKSLDNGMDFAEICERMEIGFWTLDANERVELLIFLVEECVQEADVIRKFQDDSIERTTDLKKEQREVVRLRKQIATQIAAIDKATGTVVIEAIVAQVENELLNTHNDSDSDGEFSESRSRKTRLSTSKKLQHELAKKKLEQANIPVHETEKQKSLREEKQALEDQDRTFLRRLNILDYLIRVNQGISRIKPLGRDRYCNKYWWFDGSLGALSLDTVAKIRDVPEHEDPFIPNHFAYGYVFVEELSNANGPYPQAAFEPNSDLRKGELDGKWGYYSKPEQVYLFY
jgi:hypothetical protein